MWSKNMILVVLLFVGCTPRLTTIRNPNLNPKNYTKFLVHVDSPDLDLRKKGEKQLLKSLRFYGLDGVSALELFFPGKILTTDERRSILEQNNVQAIILIESGDTGSSLYYNAFIPTLASVQWAKYQAKLFDIDHPELLWVASAKTTKIKAMCMGTIAKLIEEKMIPRLSPKREGW